MSRKLQSVGRWAGLAVAILATLVWLSAAQAQTFVWNGAAGANWSAGGNWNGGSAPTNGSALQFNYMTGSASPNNDFTAGTISFASISFDIDPNYNYGTSFAISGNQISMTVPGGIPPSRRSYFGTSLANHHPVSFSYYDALPKEELSPNPPPQLQFYNNSVMQCTTCHDAHDNTYKKFLRVSNGASSLCTLCHVMNGWTTSSHSMSQSSLQCKHQLYLEKRLDLSTVRMFVAPARAGISREKRRPQPSVRDSVDAVCAQRIRVKPHARFRLATDTFRTSAVRLPSV